MEHLPAVIVVVPLLTSFAVFLAGVRNPRPAFPLALAALSFCTVAAAALFATVLRSGAVHYRFGGWPPPWGIEYRVDHLGAFMLPLVSFLGWIAAVYGRATVRSEMPDKVPLFWCLYLLLMTGLLGIIVTADLFNLFVLLEIASLTGYALVAAGGRRAAVASFRYLVIGTVGAGFYLLGVGYLYIATGSLNMMDLRGLLPDLYASRVVHTAFVFILIGFAIKIALFPLHSWQPDTYTEAPSAVSVILSTAAAKTFAYALIRIVFSVFTVDYIVGVLPLFGALCWVAATAMIVGSVLAIGQHDLKRMLAYSSVANVGYIVLGVGLAPSSPLGVTAAVMHLLNHAVVKGCMFMAVCGILYRHGVSDIRRLAGLGRKMPLTCLSLIVASLAMVGMPPGAGFVTKWYLIRASLEAGSPAFSLVILVSTLLMIGYFWRVIEVMYLHPCPGEAPDGRRGGGELPADMGIPCMVLALLSVAAGCLWISGTMDPYMDALHMGLGLGGGP